MEIIRKYSKRLSEIIMRNRLCKTCIMSIKVLFLFAFATLGVAVNSQASTINIGTAAADITPVLPVALAGQFELRIAKSVESPLKANVIALESQGGSSPVDLVIMVACDVVSLPGEYLTLVRDEVHRQVPDLDVSKIIMTATHSHTAPVLRNDLKDNFRYQIPEEGVLQVLDYRTFFVHRVTEAIIKAWQNRRPGSVTWGLSHAVTGYNRRTVYDNGSAQMYGNTNVPAFLNMEGMEDHDVNVLFFRDRSCKLIATSINVCCPAQEVENNSAVNADYWHPVREQLKKRFGPDLCVLGWIGAAGDMSPRPMYRKAAEERMIKLRNLTRLEELGRRIVQAVEEAYETVKGESYYNVPLIHKVEKLALPMRIPTEAEFLSARAEMDKDSARIALEPKLADELLARMTSNREVVIRYRKPKIDPHPKLEVEVHVIRIGDVAICTNEFELFTDWGIQIQARSNALQTFVIQLAAGAKGYLPTEKAVQNGSYSANIQTNMVGPEGGHVLVNYQLKLINDLFMGIKE